MMKRYNVLLLVFALGAFLAAESAAQQEEVLTPSKDNTLYEDGDDLSNGSGEYLFVGRTGTNAPGGPWNRRALLAFDVASALPADARIDSVQLTLSVSNMPIQATDTEMSLHRLTRDWGEGTSDAGVPGGDGADAEADDATWAYAFYDTEEWDSPGGDYSEEASATFTVSALGVLDVESTADMVADVQLWHDDPESNFGWIIIGDESQQHTARRMDSGEFSNEERRPQLTVYFTETTASEHDELPRSLALDGNYPNPFARSTSIRYELDTADDVTLEVFDLTGRAVLQVDDGFQVAGSHAIELSARGLAAGPYMYCLQGSQSGRECRSMVVLR